MDAEYIREVIGRINKLDSKEKTHILSILKGTNNTFTKNSNGYFFNLAVVPEETISKIVKCVELIEKNRDLIKDMDRRRESLLNYYKGIIEETLLSSMRNKREKYLSMLRIVPLEHNMTFVINRKQIIKWRNQNRNDNDVDPDDLIKEYNKSRYVYDKNSTYGRILAKIKALKTGKNKGSGCDAAGDSDTFGSGMELSEYMEEEAEYYEGEVDGAGGVVYSENDKQSDYEKDLEEKSGDEPEHPDEYDKTVPEDETESDCEEDVPDPNNKSTKAGKGSKTNKPSQNKTDTEHTQTHDQEMTFYKRLLNQQGFKFREKAVVLSCEEYIE